MKEKNIIRSLILLHWTFFWGLSVLDKIIPDVYPFFVGKDFFALFVKFFASLGLKDPIFATWALAGISGLEAIVFVCFLFSFYNFTTNKIVKTKKWFFRGILSTAFLFSLFSIGDQVFGDRFQLLEHGVFWMILILSWVVFEHFTHSEETRVNFRLSNDIKIALIVGISLTLIASISIVNFSKNTYSTLNSPVQAEEISPDVYKFDFPFLADKRVWENTINNFEEKHPELKINYIYTGPDELKSKKKTHFLLYVFTEEK